MNSLMLSKKLANENASDGFAANRLVRVRSGKPSILHNWTINYTHPLRRVYQVRTPRNRHTATNIRQTTAYWRNHAERQG